MKQKQTAKDQTTMGLQEDYKVGDKVVMTDFTEVAYSKEWVSKFKNVEATVISVTKKTFQAGILEKEDRVTWRHIYGIRETYDLWGMTITFDGDKALYLASNLGYIKVAE